MDGGTADLDGDDWVQDLHGRLEGFEVNVVIGEQTKVPAVDPQADARVDVLL